MPLLGIDVDTPYKLQYHTCSGIETNCNTGHVSVEQVYHQGGLCADKNPAPFHKAEANGNAAIQVAFDLREWPQIKGYLNGCISM